MQAGVPTDIACGVRIAAAEAGIPAIGDTVITGILPVHAPAIYRCVCIVSDLYRGSEAVAPLIGNRILAGRIDSA